MTVYFYFPVDMTKNILTISEILHFCSGSGACDNEITVCYFRVSSQAGPGGACLVTLEICTFAFDAVFS